MPRLHGALPPLPAYAFIAWQFDTWAVFHFILMLQNLVFHLEELVVENTENV
jgi:hypothetical protein